MSNSTFVVGDIVRIRTPIEVVPGAARRWANKTTGRQKILKTFGIKGITGTYPFAKILIMKRFICVANTDKYTSFVLYDNYKPDYLGFGYQVHITDYNILNKVDRVIDIRKLPQSILGEILRGLQKTKHVHPYYRRTSTLSTIEYCNSSPVLIHINVKKYKEGLMDALGRSCNCCGTPLIDKRVKVYSYSVLKKNVLQESLRRENLSKKVKINPYAYGCPTCHRMSVIIIEGNEQYNYVLGETKKYIKHSKVRGK